MNRGEVSRQAESMSRATATVRLRRERGGAEVQLVTLLPELARAVKRADGEVLVAMQTTTHSGDASRDVAAALLAALELDEGSALVAGGLPEPDKHLQDILNVLRSEERRVGKECRSRWSPYH